MYNHVLFPGRLVKIKEWIDKNDPGATIIPISGMVELKLMEMTPEESAEYTKANGGVGRSVSKAHLCLFPDFKTGAIIK